MKINNQLTLFMNIFPNQKALYYSLIVITISCTVYLLSVFGLFDLYPHFISNKHLHKWHTLFRFCFVIAFAIVNHWYLVPRLYISKKYFIFLSITFLCLVSLWVLPELILPQPKFEPKDFDKKPPIPLGLHVLLIELAHVYLLFFLSTFTSIAIRTSQYLQKLGQNRIMPHPLSIDTQKTEIIEQPAETALTVTANYSLVRILFSDILFIKSMDNYIQFHFKDKKTIIVRMTLKEVLEKLPPDDFIRVHKSYIVAISAIESVRNKVIWIEKQDIPIGRAYEELVSKIFINK